MNTALRNTSPTSLSLIANKWAISDAGVNIAITPKKNEAISHFVMPLLEKNNVDRIVVLVPENTPKESVSDWVVKLASQDTECTVVRKSELGIRTDIQNALKLAPKAIVVDSSQEREDLIAAAEASKTGTIIILCVEDETLPGGILKFLGKTKSQNIGIYASIKSAAFFDGHDKTLSIDFDRDLRFELIDKTTPADIAQCIEDHAVAS